MATPYYYEEPFSTDSGDSLYGDAAKYYNQGTFSSDDEIDDWTQDPTRLPRRPPRRPKKQEA